MDEKRAAFIAHLKAKPPKSFYEMAGIERTADEEELKKAYRKLVLLLHPDKGGDTELFKVLGAFYEKALKAAEVSPAPPPKKSAPPPPPPPPKKEATRYYPYVWDDIKDFREETINGKIYGKNIKGDVMDDEGKFVGKFVAGNLYFEGKTYPVIGEIKKPEYWDHLDDKDPPSHLKFRTRAEDDAEKAKEAKRKEKYYADKEAKKADKEAKKEAKKDEAATKKLAARLQKVYEAFTALYLAASEDNQAIMKPTEKAFAAMIDKFLGHESD